MRTWLITGASSGLGKGIAEEVLERGDMAAITARDGSKLCDLASRYPSSCLPLSLELGDEESIGKAFSEAEKRFGRIDVLVNNAGYGYRAAIEEGEDRSVRDLFDADFFAPIELIKLVLPSMRRARSGMIINVTSIGAVRGAIGNGYYSAAKSALELASEALAKEVCGFGIKVMVVEPGALRTAFYGSNLHESRRVIDDYASIAPLYRKEMTSSQRQMGNPDKAGAIIVSAALSDNPPFRLLIGSDALSAARDALERRIAEINAWADVSVQSDIGDE